MVTKPNIGSHGGQANPSLSFDDAYSFCSQNPDSVFRTTGNNTPFKVIATKTTKGEHKGDRVLRFMTSKVEKGRSYECCWPFKTNCNRTHIDCYSEAIRRNI